MAYEISEGAAAGALFLSSTILSTMTVGKSEKDVKAVVNESAKFAQESPEPDPSELWTDILVEA